MTRIYVYPVDTFDRDISNQKLLQAARANNNDIRCYTVEEMVEAFNDECISDVAHWMRVIEHKPTQSPAIHLHRHDFQNIGFDAAKITDDQIKLIASKLDKGIDRRIFLTELAIMAQQMNIPRI